MSQEERPSKGTRFVTNCAALVIVVAGIKAAQTLAVPFTLAVFIAVLVAGPTAWLQKKRVPKAIGILVVFASLLAVGSIFFGFVYSSVQDFVRSTQETPVGRDAESLEEAGETGNPTLPVESHSLQARWERQLEKLADRPWLQALGLNTRQLEDFLDFGRARKFIGGLLADLLTQLSTILGDAFLILLTVVFVLLEASSFPTKLRAVSKHAPRLLAESEIFFRKVNRYMAIKTWLSVLTGTATAIWLKVVDVPYPLVWGLVAFLLNYVPTLGSIIAAVPPVLIAFTISMGTGIAAATGCVAINLVIGNFLEPRWMGRGLDLSPLVVFVSMAFWHWILGPVGMVLSVPLTMTVKIGLEQSPETRGLAVWLGSEKSAQATVPS